MAGGTDKNGAFMGGTEIMALEAVRKALFRLKRQLRLCMDATLRGAP